MRVEIVVDVEVIELDDIGPEAQWGKGVFRPLALNGDEQEKSELTIDIGGKRYTIKWDPHTDSQVIR